MIKKLIRATTSILPISGQRIGECNRCGECCKLPYPCQFLRQDSTGAFSCGIYKFRPPACRKFPRSAMQLEEVNEVCDFEFRKNKKVENNRRLIKDL